MNVKSGGRTQISGMVHALFLLAILLGLGSLVKYVPLAVLAGILITVGWGIIDFRGFKDLTHVPKADAFVLVTVFLMTVFVDLLTAVGIGMVIACFLFMMRAGEIIENQYGGRTLAAEFDKNEPWEDEKDLPEDVIKQVYIQRLNGPVFFGSITDQSGAYAMETAIKDMQAKGIEVFMTLIQPQPNAIMHKTHIIPTLVQRKHTFKTFHECILYIKERGSAGTDIA